MIIECKAIIFDLDGTLVNSIECVERAWEIWSQKYNISEKQFSSDMHGITSQQTIRRIVPHLDTYKIAKDFDEMEIIQTDGLKLIPDADKILKKLPAKQWAIATSCSKRLAISRLSSVGLPIPKILVTADDITNSKPNPEPYLLAAKHLGIPVEDCVVFEDSPAGIESGKAAGAKVIGLTTLFKKDKLPNIDAVINDFSNIKIEIKGNKLKIHIKQ